MNAITRIRQINKHLDKIRPQNNTYALIAKMDRWKYGFTSQINEYNGKDIVTQQEWEQYVTHELKLAEERGEDEEKAKQEIAELEEIIREGNGFMEIVFTNFSDPDNPTRVKM